MADLDDFFAKKDRKKNKGKKFATTEDVAKKLEDTGKKIEKPKPKDKPINTEGGEENQQIQEEDEWKEFEEEKKDYTGLKIGNLTVSDGLDDDGDNERATGENSSDGESGETGGKHSGPWKITEAPQQNEVESKPQTQQQQPAPKSSGVYVPRALQRAQLEQSALQRSRHKNVAPDINNEQYFPTLNSNKPSSNDTGVWGRKKREEGNFEEVRNRGGGRPYMQDIESQAPKLSLGNKYGALPEDQS